MLAVGLWAASSMGVMAKAGCGRREEAREAERWMVWEVEGRLTGSGMRKEGGAAARELERVND